MTALNAINANIDSVLRDPAVHDWAKRAIRELLKRDPVDAANDAILLAELFEGRCDAILSNCREAELEEQIQADMPETGWSLT